MAGQTLAVAVGKCEVQASREYVGAWTAATGTLDPTQLVTQAVNEDLEPTDDQVKDVVVA